MNTEFTGAKIAVYIGEKLAVILRDDKPDLPYAACWDFPGGGREGDEGPLACALRECHEELGLCIPACAVKWQHKFFQDGRDRWFFVAQLPASAESDIRFGDEGQYWRLMTEDEFLNHTKAIRFLQRCLMKWQERRYEMKGPPPL